VSAWLARELQAQRGCTVAGQFPFGCLTDVIATLGANKLSQIPRAELYTGGRTSPRDPLASGGTPKEPTTSPTSWAGGWGLYSGAGAPGRPKTRRRRISHGLLGPASGPPQRAPPLWLTTAGDHELIVSPVLRGASSVRSGTRSGQHSSLSRLTLT